ncbi:MAG: TIGR01777 family oxidoreductase [Ferruginibacter sp.]
MQKKIIIAGGTGFVGRYLAKKFMSMGYEVIIISRQKDHINWNNISAIEAALENAEMLINLSGKSVDCRYNEKNKKEIYDSRIDTTKALGKAILACKDPPSLWINSSTATIYRHAEDRPMTESAGEIGNGFSVNVATSWEKAFFDFTLPATRQVALRMAIVLGKEGGVIDPLRNLVRFALGGKQGRGNQMFSWIHIEDVFSIINFIQQHNELSGVFNTAAPNPVTNKNLMQLLRINMGIKIGMPMPEWLLKIGAVFIKTETELILKSRWVIPARLLEAGYQFKYGVLDEALKNILNDRAQKAIQ